MSLAPDNQDARENALRALAGHLDERVEPALWKIALDKPRSTDALIARATLACTARSETLDRLLKEFTADPALMDKVFAETAHYMPDERAKQFRLFERCVLGGDPRELAAALKVLGNRSVEYADFSKLQKPLLAALEGDDPAVAEQALAVFQRRGNQIHPCIVPVLQRIIRSGQPGLKALAIQTLALANDPRAVPVLTEALKDPDGLVRAAAARWGRIFPAFCDPQAVARLLEDPDIQVREAAASGLLYENDPKYIALFLDLIQNGSQNIQGSAYSYLRRMLEEGKAPEPEKVRAALAAFDKNRGRHVPAVRQSKPPPPQEDF